MTELTHDPRLEPDRAERADELITLVSGWAALVFAVLGFNRWAALGWKMDWWARAGLIMGAGLALMWIWGHFPAIWARLKQWKRAGGLNAFLIALALVVGLVIVNTIVRRRVQVKWDLTKNQRFTLSPRTREILTSLPDKVTVTFFAPNPSRPSQNAARGIDLLKQYADISPKFTWTLVDPLTDQETLLSKNPKNLTAPEFTSAIFEMGSKRQEITDYTEKELTSALLKMTRETERKIAFLTGHGESPLQGAGGGPGKSIQQVKQLLEDSQWKLEPLDLYRKDAPTPDPAQTAVIVIAGPERALAPEEEKRLTGYLNKGGKVLLLLSSAGPDFSKLLAQWGIKTTNDLVIGPREGGLLVATADESSHVAVRPIRGGRVAFFPMKSVSSASPAPTGITVTELIKSEPQAARVTGYVPGKTDLNAALATAKPEQVSLAALAEKSVANDQKARLIVVGDSAFMGDQLAQLPTLYNRDLAAGLVNYLAEEEALVNIAPKEENTEQAFVLPEQMTLFRVLFLFEFPLLALALAILVYLKRR
jgi:ABC-type uncharacterized transport system involved in gliding motility auxiliary subunit